LLLALTLAVPGTAAPAGATVQAIGLAAFRAPHMLDFETAPDGSISGLDTLFTDFGIVSLTAVSAAPGPDGYVGGSPFFRALFHSNTEGLLLKSMGTAPWFDRSPTFTISLAEQHFLFGVAPVDTLGEVRIRFRSLGVPVGQLTFTSDRVSTYYFHSSVGFDEVLLDEPTMNDGWGIDNITLDNPGFGDPREVPTTRGTQALLAAALVTAGAVAATRRRAAAR